MKQLDIELLVGSQLDLLFRERGLEPIVDTIPITQPKKLENGNFSTTVALVSAKKLALSPMECAHILADRLQETGQFKQVVAVSPGFVNFFCKEESRYSIIREILDMREKYGCAQESKNVKILLEFVSSNPTGPLHVGHGRGAAYGASLANILIKRGYKVDCEYYINDAGRQTSILAVSLWLRYLQNNNYDFEFPANGYQGQYLIDIARQLQEKDGKKYIPKRLDLNSFPRNSDSEQQLDDLVMYSQSQLGDLFRQLQQFVIDAIVTIIRDDLTKFRVHFDNWFSEQSLITTDKLESVMARLKQADAVYTKEGALWFASTQYGDNKDRVVRRANGEYTYFATDIAYHADKFARGYELVINLFGADHHGYIARLKAAMMALGYNQDNLEICLIQFANLARQGDLVSMSTRAGDFVELSTLVDETGVDAARFFYLMRRHEQHLIFDIDLAKSQTRDNPVYYVQYAYARINQILQKAHSKGFILEKALVAISSLEDKREQAIIGTLSRFPHLLEQAAITRSPHLVSQYVRELAALFHNYYAGVRVLDDSEHWQSRLCLCLAVQQVLANGLEMLNVSLPKYM